jgi:hypothetical protein
MAIITGIKPNKAAIVWRIEDITDPPPELTMLINPGNLDTSYTQLINETRTLGGFVQEFWGEQLTTLSSSGRTALSYGVGGLSNTDARQSSAYENFVRLVDIYRCNGKDYKTLKTFVSDAKNPDRIMNLGTVVMSYEGIEYAGYFENFSVRELGDKPFYFEYDFSFKVMNITGDLLVQSKNYVKSA